VWAGPDSDRRPSARQAPDLTLDWSEYKDGVYHKYAKSWAPNIMTYSKMYSHILLSGDIKEIDKISPKTKNTSIKALVILSKYLEIHEEFKGQLKSYGIKLYKADALGSFMRLYNNPSLDLMDWYAKALKVLRPNEQLFSLILTEQKNILEIDTSISLEIRLERILSMIYHVTKVIILFRRAFA
jgi:hypothetical protein